MSPSVSESEDQMSDVEQKVSQQVSGEERIKVPLPSLASIILDMSTEEYLPEMRTEPVKTPQLQRQYVPRHTSEPVHTAYPFVAHSQEFVLPHSVSRFGSNEQMRHAELLFCIAEERQRTSSGNTIVSSEANSPRSDFEPNASDMAFNYIYECPYCTKRFKRKGDLVRHGKTAHGNAPGIYHCQICDARFQRPDSYKRHHSSQGHIRRERAYGLMSGYNGGRNNDQHSIKPDFYLGRNSASTSSTSQSLPSISNIF